MGSIYVSLVMPGYGECADLYYMVDISEGIVVSGQSSGVAMQTLRGSVSFITKCIENDKEKTSCVLWLAQPRKLRELQSQYILVSAYAGEDLIQLPVRETDRANLFENSIVECVRIWHRDASFFL